MKDTNQKNMAGAEINASGTADNNSPACTMRCNGGSEGNVMGTSSPNKRRRQSNDSRNAEEVKPHQFVGELDSEVGPTRELPSISDAANRGTFGSTSPSGEVCVEVAKTLHLSEEPPELPTRRADISSLLFSECEAVASEAAESTVDGLRIQGEEALAEEDEEEDEPDVQLQVRWGSRVIVLQLKSLDLETFTVGDAKERIEAITTVPADKQVRLCH